MTNLRILCLLVMAAVTCLAMAEDPRAIIRGIGFDQNLNRSLPLELTFKDETGTPVPLKKYISDKPVILTLVYHGCPMLCGAELHGLVTCLRAMSYSAGKEFEILTISFDPNETTSLSAAKKAEYVREYGHPGAQAGWHFLTGDQASIDALTQVVGFRYRYDAISKTYGHASGIVILTPQGTISRYYFGVEYYPRDITLALVEASQNKIGNLADQVLLYCYRYDPMTGRYGLVILNILRFSAVLTVLILGTFMVAMFVRDRRLRRTDIAFRPPLEKAG